MRAKAILTSVVTLATVVGAVAVGLNPAQAEPSTTASPASGAFSFTTGPGILTTWAYNSIKVTGASPAAYIPKNNGTQAFALFPVVAHEKTAVFTGGSIRITNTKTGDYINCLNPAVDTLVRVVDCVMPDRTNMQLFAISDMASVRSLPTIYSVNTSYTGMELKIASQEVADYMNLKLHTNTFSPSVVFATGELTVSYPR